MKTGRAHLIANFSSGAGEGIRILELAQTACDRRGIALVTYDTENCQDWSALLSRAVTAAREDGGIVLAAGGDGTMRTVAQAVAGTPVPMGAIPVGTFNFFARAHGIPEDPGAAIELALSGRPETVQVGQVNGLVFLVNASLGAYAKSIEQREISSKKFGRHRIVATLATVFTLLKGTRPIRLKLNAEKQQAAIRTPLVFVGNNRLQLEALNFSVAEKTGSDGLAVIVMKPATRWEMAKIILNGWRKEIDRSEKVDSFLANDVWIDSKKQSYELALDGERFHVEGPLHFESRPHDLKLVVPVA